MSLDAYAYAVPEGTELDLNDTNFLHYWQGNNALHNWMGELYNEFGQNRGDGSEPDLTEDFNQTPMQLHFEDLEQLREGILANKLTDTSGFWQGSQVYTEEQKAEDLAFVNAAMERITEGFDIYYSAWY